MRLLVDLVVLATLLAVIAGAVLHNRAVDREHAAVQEVREGLRRIEKAIRVKSATETTEVNGRGWPIDIDPDWFEDNPPQNRLLTPDRPWLEIAPTDQATLMHPPIRMAFDRSIAAFWYNPANGVVRARVPVTISDQRATELYNRINGVFLTSIFEGLSIPDDRPMNGFNEEDAKALAEILVEEDLDPTKPLTPAPEPAPN